MPLTAMARAMMLMLLTPAAWIAACSGSIAKPTGDAGAVLDTGSSSEDAGSDGCPVAHNEAGCPATFDTVVPHTCSPAGLECLYPGSGDEGPCSVAELYCFGGGDGGAYWVPAQ
jgi:hypothetical protein